MPRPGLFGWDYPPGCSGPPEPDGPCDVCGSDLDACCCPACPTCHVVGRPSCYGPAGHGLTLTAEQRESQDRAKLAADLEAERADRDAEAYAADLERDRLESAAHHPDPRPWYEIIP